MEQALEVLVVQGAEIFLVLLAHVRLFGHVLFEPAVKQHCAGKERQCIEYVEGQLPVAMYGIEHGPDKLAHRAGHKQGDGVDLELG